MSLLNIRLAHTLLASFLFLSMVFSGHNSVQAEALKDVLRLTMPKARVTQIVDGQTVIVNNTTTLSLPMIYIPWDSPQDPGEGMKRAKDYLEKELKDRFIKVYQIRDQKRGQLNALGHTQAYIERDDGLFVQRGLIENGLAFAYPTQSHFEMADVLYEAEDKAREAKVGFWADPKWDVMSDQEAKSIKDRFGIVEGKIDNIATRNNTIYLNFERDWKTDFTISLDSSRRRDFAKAGGNVMQWSGKKVQVRGWIREYNGPFVEIFHPSQIRVLEQTAE